MPPSLAAAPRKKRGTSGKKKPPKFGRPTAKEWAAHKPPHTARSSWVLAFATRGGRGLPSRSNASHDELCRPSPDACQTFTGRSRREDVALGCARERSWFHPGDASIPVSRRQDTELGHSALVPPERVRCGYAVRVFLLSFAACSPPASSFAPSACSRPALLPCV